MPDALHARLRRLHCRFCRIGLHLLLRSLRQHAALADLVFQRDALQPGHLTGLLGL
ncbi:hypothetical protein [Methylibium sp.]|uniref:hypothetical protein n=1 Tax=Methylibium sp. TaxID=2067992 RepID=UPI00180CD521|nr:hypothetical protein [Methylibium sp.]MBA3588210.1 hypothetical protein [Methylibium sp.]